MTMRMSADGRAALIAREGKRLTAYKDTVGVWTIGVGHTSAAGPPNVTKGLTITDAECDEILARDLVQYEDAVNSALTRAISQKSFDALVSLCFNIGTGGFAKSTVVKRINAGDMTGAAEAILMWDKPPEIMGRRMQEYGQFKTGLYDDVPPPAQAAMLPLSRGDGGKDVKALQSQLKAAGIYAGKIDGDFGPATDAAVRELQRRQGLKVDGIAGPKTRAALTNLL